MTKWHDESDGDEQCFGDLKGKHTPDSVRESAERELLRRGFSKEEIFKETDFD